MKIKKHLEVGWADQSWEVGIRDLSMGATCGLPREALRPVRGRFDPVVLPPGAMPFFTLEHMSRAVSARLSRPRPRGFTLIELLVVIAIIAILAGILLPVLSGLKTKGKIAYARTEMQGLIASIKQYESDYNRYPASPLTEQASANTDFTFGTGGIGPPPGSSAVLNNIPGRAHETNNSELVVIVMDVERYVNVNHFRNPRSTKYWNPKMVSSPIGGVSTDDYIARDPWGNPYMVTVDMNDDNKCLDAFYRLAGVSAKTGDVGHYGLSRPQGVAGDRFELNGPVMIWSLGPNGMCDSGTKANEGVNRDNVLSWSN